MSNAPVPAAAAGMPKSTRRSFMTSAAAVAVVAPVSIASPASPANDPVFAAISAWEDADAEWLAKVDVFGASEEACDAENAAGDARLDVEICGVPFTFRTDEEIAYFLRTLPNRGASAAENLERMAQAGKRFRAELGAERKRVDLVQAKHRYHASEAAMVAASNVAKEAAGRVVATVPTTPACLRALTEFIAVPDRLYVGQDETGLASLAAACRALLPAA